MWCSAGLFGVGSGGTAPLIPAITGDYLGTKNLATMTMAILIGVFFGPAVGPWMTGLLFDVTNPYVWPLILPTVLTGIALVDALRLGSPVGEAR